MQAVVPTVMAAFGQTYFGQSDFGKFWCFRVLANFSVLVFWPNFVVDGGCCCCCFVVCVLFCCVCCCVVVVVVFLLCCCCVVFLCLLSFCVCGFGLRWTALRRTVLRRTVRRTALRRTALFGVLGLSCASPGGPVWWGQGTKRAKFWAPPFRGPTLRGVTFFWVWAPHNSGAHISRPPPSGQVWPKSAN